MTQERATNELRGFADPARGNAADLIAYLDTMMAGQPSAERYRLKYELLDLGQGEAVLDLGCGAGADVLRIAREIGPTGRAVGIDLNPAMVEAVRERAAAAGLTNVEAQVGGDGVLPFADGTFDVVHTERVLIHVADPDATLREVVRVLRPGGRVVACETDFGTRAVDIDDLELANLVYGHGGAGPRNRYMGRQLHRRFHRAGLESIDVKSVPLQATGQSVSTASAQQLDSDLRMVVESGRITESEADRFRAMRQARLEASEFFQVVLLMLARGVKPA